MVKAFKINEQQLATGEIELQSSEHEHLSGDMRKSVKSAVESLNLHIDLKENRISIGEEPQITKCVMHTLGGKNGSSYASKSSSLETGIAPPAKSVEIPSLEATMSVDLPNTETKLTRIRIAKVPGEGFKLFAMGSSPRTEQPASEGQQESTSFKVPD